MRTSDHTTNPSFKRCSRCGEIKPLTEFYPRLDRSCGYVSQCKACARQRKKVYDNVNHDEIRRRENERRQTNLEVERKREREWARQYRAQNPGASATYQRKYYRANRDTLLQKRRDYDSERREIIRQQNRNWRKVHPYIRTEKRREWERLYRAQNQDKLRREMLEWANSPKGRARNQRRRARKLGLPDTFTGQEWERCLAYFEHRCAACNRPRGLWHRLAVDHWIPLNNPNCPGTVATNAIPLCHGQDGCNNSKGDKDPMEWLVQKFGKRKANQIAKRIADYFQWVKDRS